MKYFIKLNISLSKRQWMSAVFIFFCAFSTLLFNDRERIHKEISQVHDEHKNAKIISKLYLEYCLSRVVDRGKCIFSKPFFLLKQKNRNYDKSKQHLDDLLADMGKEFKQKEHYEQFYIKLINKEKEIVLLPSYKEYQNYQKEVLQKLHARFSDFKLASKYNYDVLSLLNSLFLPSHAFQTVWSIFLLFLFSPYVEQKQGSVLFVLINLTLPMSLLLYYVRTLSFDSISFVSAQGVLISFILGQVLGFFSRYSLELTKRKHQALFSLRLIYIIPLFYLIQELMLNFLSPSLVPHRVHFIAFVTGLTFSMLIKKMDGLPEGFLFKSELKEFSWLKSQKDNNLKINGMYHLIKANPLNQMAREDLVSEMTQMPSSLLREKEFILNEVFADYLVYCLRKRKFKLSLTALESLPDTCFSSSFFKRVSSKSFFSFFLWCQKNASNLLFLNLIRIYYEVYYDSKRCLECESFAFHFLKNKYVELKTRIDDLSQGARSVVLRDMCLNIRLDSKKVLE
ncbi:MAG: hypothetical protein QF441_04205 [Bacteriovoracaceae bacterium]|jgi:hypothetical protein|nr:hypothetical protein [Bacteriovoracaceae bacterium]